MAAVLVLGAWVRRSRLGQLLSAPVDVVLSDHDVVQPDILLVSNDRRERLGGDRIVGAPDLMIEILSPSTRRTDEVRKRHLYDRSGVVEYWVVDPNRHTISVYRRAPDERFRRVADLAAANGDELATPLLPGLAVNLRDLFA